MAGIGAKKSKLCFADARAKRRASIILPVVRKINRRATQRMARKIAFARASSCFIARLRRG